MTVRSGAMTGATFFALLTVSAQAQQVQSSHTELDLDRCTVITSDDFGSTWACPGLKGFPVMIAERDLRMFVSYGLTSTTEKAARQTLPPVNRLGEEIEWRVSNAEGQYKPFATILRFLTQGGDGEAGEVLVVTQLKPGATCHVAYVDARANPDAEALARRAADESARDFDCAGEPGFVGKFEAWER